MLLIDKRKKEKKEMRKVSAMIIIALLCFSMLSIFAPQVKAEPSETPLEVAEKAADWVISEAIVEGDGYKWPYITWGGKLFYTSLVTSGAAGIGEFMLSLYEKTGKTVYMDYAIGAANYVVARAEPDAGGYRWGHPDDELSNWYLVPGISSVGIFLLKMYQATGDSTYLEYAAGAGRWFMAYAIWEGAGCYIKRNPPQQALHEYKTGGTEEACKLLVRLYSVTGDTDYLTYVQGFSNWLMSDAQSVGDGYRWVYGRPWAPGYNLVNDCFMATLFYDLYQEFGDAVYLQYANGAIDWVLSQAVAVDGKYKWAYSPGGTQYPLAFQSDEGLIELDLVTFGDALLMAYSVTSNPTLLEYAEGHAEWIWSQRVEENGGCKFPSIEGGSNYNAHINARIFSFFSRISETTGETKYAQYAEAAFAWIVDNAIASDGGYKWMTISRPPYYPIWFQEGAAGIGYYIASGEPVSQLHPAIKMGLESLQALRSGVISGAEIVDGETLGTAIEVLKTAVDFIPVPSTKILILEIIAGEVVDITASALLEKIKGVADTDTLQTYYTEGDFSATIDMWKSDIASFNDIFLNNADEISTDIEFIADMQAFHQFVQQIGNGYPENLDGIVEAHEWESFGRDIIFASGGIAIIIVTWGAAAPYVVAFEAAYHGMTGVYNIRDEQDFFKSLSAASLQQMEDALYLAQQVSQGLGYLAEKLDSEDFSFPQLRLEPLPGGGAWIWNEYDKDVNVKLTHSVTLTCYEEQTIEPPQRHYEVPYGEFTIPPGSFLLFLSSEPPDDIKQWREHLESFGYSVEDWSSLRIFYGEGGYHAMKTAPLPVREEMLSVMAESPVHLLVTDPNGLRVGYDSESQTVVNEIAGATYSGLGAEPEAIIISSPIDGVYNIDAFGIGEGAYTLSLKSIASDGSVIGSQTCTGETSEGKTDLYSASIPETGEMEVFSWEYVFEDTKRGTMLKISTDDKYFQFIAPDKEFSIKEAYKMVICKSAIFIWHKDSEIELVTVAIDTKIDFCFAYAKDVQTRKSYLLIDPIGNE